MRECLNEIPRKSTIDPRGFSLFTSYRKYQYGTDGWTKKHASKYVFDCRCNTSSKSSQELEMRIDTQKQTLTARDESIKKLLEMLQNKGEGINLIIFSNSLTKNGTRWDKIPTSLFSSWWKSTDSRLQARRRRREFTSTCRWSLRNRFIWFKLKEFSLINGPLETGSNDLF